MQPRVRRLFAGAANAASTMHDGNYSPAFKEGSDDKIRPLRH